MHHPVRYTCMYIYKIHIHIHIDIIRFQQSLSHMYHWLLWLNLHWHIGIINWDDPIKIKHASNNQYILLKLDDVRYISICICCIIYHYPIKISIDTLIYTNHICWTIQMFPWSPSSPSDFWMPRNLSEAPGGSIPCSKACMAVAVLSWTSPVD